jgi:aminoglycoside 6'-N-acetyltransferase I
MELPCELVNLNDADEWQRQEAARILQAALAHVPSAWKTASAARAEVNTFVGNPERIGLLAVEGDALRGWIGAIRHTTFAWELHPLAVDPTVQRRGWGRRLVMALEQAACAAGVIAIWLGSDDDFGGTNLYGQDLYPDVLGRLRELQPTGGHPFTFYQRLGYTVTGVLPDVDGPGKHDIIMAKRLTQATF